MSQLFFRNSVGKIYEDKLVIGKTKFFLNRIDNIDLIKVLNKRINIYLFLCFVLFGIGVFFTRESKPILFYSFIFLCTLSFVSTIFYRHNVYFIYVRMEDFQKFEILINKSNKEEAKRIIKETLELIKLEKIRKVV